MESEPVNKVGSEVLYYEQGASWAWLLLGPFAGVGMAILQMTGGYGHDLWIPIVFLVLVSVFVAIQIKAARIHTSVELTAETLRQGAETLRVDEIVLIWLAEDTDDGRPWLGHIDAGGRWWFVDASVARNVTHWAHRPRAAK